MTSSSRYTPNQETARVNSDRRTNHRVYVVLVRVTMMCARLRLPFPNGSEECLPPSCATTWASPLAGTSLRPDQLPLADLCSPSRCWRSSSSGRCPTATSAHRRACRIIATARPEYPEQGVGRTGEGVHGSLDVRVGRGAAGARGGGSQAGAHAGRGQRRGWHRDGDGLGAGGHVRQRQHDDVAHAESVLLTFDDVVDAYLWQCYQQCNMSDSTQGRQDKTHIHRTCHRTIQQVPACGPHGTARGCPRASRQHRVGVARHRANRGARSP